MCDKFVLDAGSIETVFVHFALGLLDDGQSTTWAAIIVIAIKASFSKKIFASKMYHMVNKFIICTKLQQKVMLTATVKCVCFLM